MSPPTPAPAWLSAVGRVRVAASLVVGVGVAAGATLAVLHRPAPPPGAHLAVPDAPRARQPNVVLIIVDTLRADHLGVYGHPASPSPELDAIAEAGLRVQTVVAPTTWTRPSIGTMVTGLHPRSLGIYSEDRHALPDAPTTLAEAFSAAGYTTLGTTANPNINPYYGFDQGFDWYQGTDQLFDWMPADAVGITEAEATRRRRRGRDLPSAQAVLDTISGAIDAHPEGPWFVQLNVMDVHEFSVDSLDLPADVAALYSSVPSRSARRYLQAVTTVSRRIDAFARDLYARPGWADTLLVITSDHGETFDHEEHPSVADPRWHGHLVYESQALVPLILYNPSDPSLAGVLPGPVGLVDLAPTLLAYAGVPLPEELDGHDIRSDTSAPAGSYVVETLFRGVEKIALYEPEWHYIANRDAHAGLPELELQAAGRSEDGSATSQLGARTDEADALAARLAEWERAHPKTPPTLAEGPVPETIQEQLQAIGYIE